MSDGEKKTEQEKPVRKKITSSSRTKSANERSSRVSRDKEQVISKSDLLANDQPKEVKKIREKTSSHSKIAQDLIKSESSSHSRHRQRERDTLCVSAGPTVGANHNAALAQYEKELLSFEAERDKFEKQRKEFEAQQAAFIKQSETELAALNSTMAAAVHKEEDLHNHISDLITSLNSLKTKKNDREEKLYKQIEELRATLANHERAEREENDGVQSQWANPISYDAKTGTDVEIRGEWKGRSCGGCFNHRTWVNNPNIFFTVKKNCTVTISLFQPLASEIGADKLMHHMSFYVFRTYSSQGRRQLKKVAESDIVCEGYYSNLRPNKVTVTADIAASSNPYIILPSTFYPECESQWVVKIKASEEISARLISEKDEWPSYEGKWEGKHAGGCTNFPSFIDNPQYLVKMRKSANVQFHLTQLRDQFDDTIGLYVIKAEPGQSQKLTAFKQADALKYVEFRSAQEALLDIHLDAGNEYIVLPCTFNPKRESTFRLRVLHSEADHPCDALVPLRDVHWVSVKSSFNSSNAGGSINEPLQWQKNVQYAFTLEQDTKIGLFLDQTPQQGSNKLWPVSWMLFNADRRVTYQEAEQKTISSPDYRPNKRLFENLSLKKGKYVIVPATFEANQFCEYELKFASPTILETSGVTLNVI